MLGLIMEDQVRLVNITELYITLLKLNPTNPNLNFSTFPGSSLDHVTLEHRIEYYDESGWNTTAENDTRFCVANISDSFIISKSDLKTDA